MLIGSFLAYICLRVFSVTLRGGADLGPLYTVSSGCMDAMLRACNLSSMLCDLEIIGEVAGVPGGLHGISARYPPVPGKWL